MGTVGSIFLILVSGYWGVISITFFLIPRLAESRWTLSIWLFLVAYFLDSSRRFLGFLSLDSKIFFGSSDSTLGGVEIRNFLVSYFLSFPGEGSENFGFFGKSMAYKLWTSVSLGGTTTDFLTISSFLTTSFLKEEP